MSNEEHYFENLLFAYSKGGMEQYDLCKQKDSNIQYLDEKVKFAIESCASYIIDCCDWQKEYLGAFLSGNFECGHSCGCC